MTRRPATVQPAPVLWVPGYRGLQPRFLCVALQLLEYCYLILQGQPLRDSVVAALANDEHIMFVRVERAAEDAAGDCFRSVELTAPVHWDVGMPILAGLLWQDFTNTGVPTVPGYSVTHKLGTGATSIVYGAVRVGAAESPLGVGSAGGAAGAGGGGAGSGNEIAVKVARPGMDMWLVWERHVLGRVSSHDVGHRVVGLVDEVEASPDNGASPSRGRRASPAASSGPATLCMAPVCRHFRAAGPRFFALHHAQQVLQGLQAIHAAGFVHRDCRASNIMVNPSGDAVVGDLGFAAEVRCAAAPYYSRSSLHHLRMWLMC